MEIKDMFKPTIGAWEMINQTDEPVGFIHALFCGFIFVIGMGIGEIIHAFGYTPILTGNKWFAICGLFAIAGIFYPITVTILTAPISAILCIPLVLKKYIFKL